MIKNSKNINNYQTIPTEIEGKEFIPLTRLVFLGLFLIPLGVFLNFLALFATDKQFDEFHLLRNGSVD